jgi:hypothetical protein
MFAGHLLWSERVGEGEGVCPEEILKKQIYFKLQEKNPITYQ